ncbi:MAG: BACON domain-containing protein [Bacteroidaceae bacterium]|nr:BACON domain-containing protein [Bacteroidaceae bacterium]
MKQSLLKQFSLRATLLALFLCAVGGTAWADNYYYKLYSGDITEGDYIIYYNGKAMKNVISSNRFSYEEVTPVNNIITRTSATNNDAIVWHIAANSTYWTIYNAAVTKYAASTGSKNQGKLEASVTDNSKWTVTGSNTYEFENKARAAASSDSNNKWLRNNGTNGFACYASGTGGALSLYKKVTPPSAPSFSVIEETFNAAFELTITGATGTTLKYTTDGSAPADAEATATNTATIDIPAATTRVRAIAIKDGMNSSETDITFTYVDLSKTTPSFSLSPTAVEMTIGETGKSITLTTNSTGAISFASDKSGLTIDNSADSKIGVLNATAAGTYKVTVTAEANETYNSATDDVTVTVNKRTPTVTISDASLTNTDIYSSTAAGSLSATVKDGNDVIDGATVTWSSTVPGVATINSSGVVTLVAEGTTTIKASYAGNDTYVERIAEYELTVEDTDPVIKINLNNTFFNTEVHTSGQASNDLNYSGSKQGITVTYDVKSGSNYYLNTGQIRTYSGVTLTIEAPVGYIIKGISFVKGDTWSAPTASVGTVKGNDKDSWEGKAISVTFSWTSKSFMSSVAVLLAPGSAVSAAGYTTYVTPEALEFTDVEAFIATTVGENSITLSEVTSAPANTPVIVKASANTYEFTPTDSPASINGNQLLASDGTVFGNGSTIFALGKKNGIVAFYLVVDGERVPEGKAYLDEPAAIKGFLDFNFNDGTPTAIETVKTIENSVMFNLAGQRVNKAQKGIFIQNGKKVIR